MSEPATYNLYEAKTQLSELVDRAAGGEVVVIAKSGVPTAHLAPIPEPPKPPLRRPGLLKGKIWVADDFDDLPIFPEEWEAMRRQEREDDERWEQERQRRLRGGEP